MHTSGNMDVESAQTCEVPAQYRRSVYLSMRRRLLEKLSRSIFAKNRTDSIVPRHKFHFSKRSRFSSTLSLKKGVFDHNEHENYVKDSAADVSPYHHYKHKRRRTRHKNAHHKSRSIEVDHLWEIDDFDVSSVCDKEFRDCHWVNRCPTTIESHREFTTLYRLEKEQYLARIGESDSDESDSDSSVVGNEDDSEDEIEEANRELIHNMKHPDFRLTTLRLSTLRFTHNSLSANFRDGRCVSELMVSLSKAIRQPCPDDAVDNALRYCRIRVVRVRKAIARSRKINGKKVRFDSGVRKRK